MIVFDVTCKNDHTFEGWFKDGDTFDSLVSKGEVACPICGDTHVRKGLVAPRLGGMRKGKDRMPEPAEAGEPADNGKAGREKKKEKRDAEEFREFLSAVGEKRHVEENSTYVATGSPRRPARSTTARPSPSRYTARPRLRKQRNSMTRASTSTAFPGPRSRTRNPPTVPPGNARRDYGRGRSADRM